MSDGGWKVFSALEKPEKHEVDAKRQTRERASVAMRRAPSGTAETKEIGMYGGRGRK